MSEPIKQLCSGCFKPSEHLTKAGICAVCGESRKGESKGARTTWGNERYAAIFSQRYGDKLVWDSALNIFWRYAKPDGSIPKDDNYVGCSWRPYYEDKMERDVFKMLKSIEHGKHLTDGVVKDIVKLCRFTANDGVDFEDGITDRYLSFADTLIDPDTLERKPHHPSDVATIHFDIPFDGIKEVACPMFDRYLDISCRDENGVAIPEMPNQIYEMIGYLLSNLNVHKSFFLQGGGGNGKSVLLHLIESIIGKSRCSSLSIEQMEGFTVTALFGRKVNIRHEDESEGISPVNYKTMVAGETLEIRDLYSKPRKVSTWPKFVTGCNIFPTFKHFGEAMLRRCLIYTFDYKVPKKDIIVDLHKKIIANGEIPAIVWRSLQALQRLNANGFQFTETEQSREALSTMEDASSTISSYIKRTWVRGNEDDRVEALTVYQGYCVWCDQNGHRHVSSSKFHREASEFLGKNKPMRIGASTARGYYAKLKTEAPTQPTQPTQPTLGSYESNVGPIDSH